MLIGDFQHYDLDEIAEQYGHGSDSEYGVAELRREIGLDEFFNGAVLRSDRDYVKGAALIET